jgi:glycosyltransferase involved in cell wall biosynthesis
MKSLKFCFVSEIAPYLNSSGKLVVTGGGEAHAFFLARELVKKGHCAKIVTGKWVGAPAHEFIDGVEFVRYGSYSLWFSSCVALSIKNLVLNSVRSFKVIEEVIKKNRPDFIVAPMTFAFPRVVFEAYAHRIPMVAEVHDVYPLPLYLKHYRRDYGLLVYPGSLFVWLYNTLPKYTSLVETVSAATVNPLVSKCGVKREKIFVTGNGVDTEKYLYSSEKQQLILVLGRLVSYKNVDRALCIFRKVKEQVKNAKLVIVGDGPERKRLEALSKDSDVQFLGHVSEAKKLELLQQAKILISCSEFEGFGMAPIEALACGVFPVLSDIPAHHEVVGKHSFISDNVDNCASIIVDLLSDEAKRGLIAKGGRDFVVSTYTWQSVCEKFLLGIEHLKEKISN